MTGDSQQPYRLRFTLRPAISRSIIVGLLELVDGNSQLSNAYRASSSRPNMQYWGSWRDRGGLIPPDEPYQVATKAIWMPENPGVGGKFFPITPFEIETIGDTRGDFGLHADANAAVAPGTLGCIFPLTEKGWTAIKRDFEFLAAKGIVSLPLSVSYLK
jgi:hypothetical protein